MSQIFGRYNVECSAEFSEFRESVVPTQAMEEHKNMHPPQFLEQSEVSVEGLFYVIKDNEKELRDCYAEILLFFYNFSLIISSQVLMHVIVSYNKNSKPKKLKNQNKKKILNS
jgi:hypothetical protein